MAQTPGFNLGELMKQAQMIEQSFEANKEKLRQETATATVGGGMVTATVNGEKQVVEVKISKNADDNMFKLNYKSIENFNDIKVGDIIEAYEMVVKK